MASITQGKNESTLLKKVWDIANVLAAAGVGFTDYITQLTYILFLKMDSEKEELGLGSAIPEGYKWEDLVELNGTDLVDKYEEILKELSKDTGLIGTIFTKASNKIDRPVMLAKVIEMVNGENWYMMDGDFKGAIYESILEKNGQDKKSGAGQYFTPRALIKAIVDVVDPKITETVADPACGTGGFLTSALQVLDAQVQTVEDRTVYSNSIYGIEKKALPFLLCATNMLLHDIDNPRIIHGNSLEKNVREYKESDRFDVMLMNPPYGGNEKEGVKQNFPADLRSSETADLFMSVIMYRLKQNGRCAIILPDGFLFGTDNAKMAIKEKLLSEFNLHMDEQNKYSGLVFCADCGSNMVLHRAHTMSASYNHFTCRTYKKDGEACTGHYIRECVLDEIVLEDLRRVTSAAREHPEKFAVYIGSKQSTELQREIRRQEKELAAMRKRKAELDAIFKKLYEDSVLGRITTEQFQMLSGSYTEEQNLITVGIPQKESEIQHLRETVSGTDSFLDKAKRYTDITELTPELLRLFIEKIVVHEKEVKWSKHAPQTVEIYYNGIGYVGSGQQDVEEALEAPEPQGTEKPRQAS